MRIFLKGAAIASLIAAAPASQAAEVITLGSFAPGESVNVQNSIYLGPGAYRFSLALSAPVQGFTGEVLKTYIYNFYCDAEGNGVIVYCGGDEVPIAPQLELVTPTLYQAELRVNPPATIPAPGGQYEDNFDICCDYQFGFEAVGAGGYRFSVAAVPEPATWALMVLGFGAIGAAMRRRGTVKAVHARPIEA
ncbi:MAG: PEPxxWA-CTERM sorting domain-containing protein [Pseudomonadota bacterium]